MRCVYSDSVNRKSPYVPRTIDTHPAESRGNVLEKKLDRALALLEDLRSRSDPGQGSLAPVRWDDRQDGHDGFLSPAAAIDSAFSDDGFGQLEICPIAARTSSCESILAWPALQSISNGHVPRSFVFQASSNTGNDIAHGQSISEGGRPMVYEESLWPLFKRFLVLVHVKNPVLDESKFKQYVREASECGPGWDGPGCLVVSSLSLVECRADSPSTHSFSLVLLLVLPTRSIKDSEGDQMVVA